MLFPTDFPISGSLFGPKTRRATIRTRMISQGPTFGMAAPTTAGNGGSGYRAGHVCVRKDVDRALRWAGEPRVPGPPHAAGRGCRSGQPGHRGDRRTAARAVLRLVEHRLGQRHRPDPDLPVA